MIDMQKMDVRDAHAYFAKECFNQTWDLIEKQERTQADVDMMIHMAHASIYHWSRRVDCTDQNLSIGYWQLARVYALAGLGDCALRSAQTCLNYSQQHGVAKVFLGYAHEALARAYAISGDRENSIVHLNQVKEIAQTIVDDDREQLLADVADLEN